MLEHAWGYLHYCSHKVFTVAGTRFGPYFGKVVHKEEMEGDAHKWLWEVGMI